MLSKSAAKHSTFPEFVSCNEILMRVCKDAFCY